MPIRQTLMQETGADMPTAGRIIAQYGMANDGNVDVGRIISDVRSIADGLGIGMENSVQIATQYARNHEGAVEPDRIVSDIRDTASHIVDNLPRAAAGYDFGHEVTSCGKYRQFDAIEKMSGDGIETRAFSCLASNYADDTEAWSGAVYDTCRTAFEERAFGNGIEGFREYVHSLPYGGHTLNSVVDALSEGDNTLRFVAENGTSRDLRELMIDVRPNANDPDAVMSGSWDTGYRYPEFPLDTGHNGTTQHGCPRAVIERIYDAASERVGTDSPLYFNRDEIMRHLGAVSRSDLSNEEKNEVSGIVLDAHLNGDDYDERAVAAIARSDIPDRLEAVREYMSCDDSGKRYLDNVTRADISPDVKSEIFSAVAAEDRLSGHKATGLEVMGVNEQTVTTRYEALMQALETRAETDGISRHDLDEALENDKWPNGGNGMIEESEGSVIYHFYDPITSESVDFPIVGGNTTRLDNLWNEADRYDEDRLGRILENIDASELSAGQMAEIRQGLENGLTIEQIEVYAKPEYDADQMRVIREGFENGLTPEQVAVFAKPEYDYLQMIQISNGFENGLTPEQVAVFAKPEYSHPQMREICFGLEHGLAPEQVAVYARSEYEWSQMREIRFGLEHGLAPEQVELYANPALVWYEMAGIREELEADMPGEKDLADVGKELTDPEFLSGIMDSMEEENVEQTVPDDAGWVDDPDGADESDGSWGDWGD